MTILHQAVPGKNHDRLIWPVNHKYEPCAPLSENLGSLRGLPLRWDALEEVACGSSVSETSCQRVLEFAARMEKMLEAMEPGSTTQGVIYGFDYSGRSSEQSAVIRCISQQFGSKVGHVQLTLELHHGWIFRPDTLMAYQTLDTYSMAPPLELPQIPQRRAA